MKKILILILLFVILNIGSEVFASSAAVSTSGNAQASATTGSKTISVSSDKNNVAVDTYSDGNGSAQAQSSNGEITISSSSRGNENNPVNNYDVTAVLNKPIYNKELSKIEDKSKKIAQKEEKEEVIAIADTKEVKDSIDKNEIETIIDQNIPTQRLTSVEKRLETINKIIGWTVALLIINIIFSISAIIYYLRTKKTNNSTIRV